MRLSTCCARDPEIRTVEIAEDTRLSIGEVPCLMRHYLDQDLLWRAELLRNRVTANLGGFDPLVIHPLQYKPPAEKG